MRAFAHSARQIREARCAQIQTRADWQRERESIETERLTEMVPFDEGDLVSLAGTAFAIARLSCSDANRVLFDVRLAVVALGASALGEFRVEGANHGQ